MGMRRWVPEYEPVAQRAAAPPRRPDPPRGAAKAGTATGWALYPLGQEITPARIKSVLLAAQAGETQQYYAFLEHVERDPHIAACLGAATRRITSGRIDVRPYPATARTRTGKVQDVVAARALGAAQVVESGLFRGTGPREAVKALVKADWRGIAGVEPVYSPDGVLLVLEEIPGQNFSYVKGIPHVQVGELQSDRVPCADLVVMGQLVYRQVDGKISNPALRGIAARLVPYFFIKYRLPYWWGRYTELYGVKPRIGKYPAGDEITHALLDEAQQLMGAAGWANIPQEASIELLTESGKAGADVFGAVAEWCDRQASKLILGGTQTMDISAGAGSQATAEVHERQEIMLAADRAEDVADCMRPMFGLMVAWAMGPAVAAEHTPTLSIDVSRRPSLTEIAGFVKDTVPAGARLPESWFYDVTGVWIPEEGEACLGSAAAPPPSASASVTAAVPPRLWTEQEYRQKYLNGAGAEIVAYVEGVLDRAENEGWTIGRLYAEIQRLQPVAPERLQAIIAAMRMEALARGFGG